jgi:hypothetical protein
LSNDSLTLLVHPSLTFAGIFELASKSFNLIVSFGQLVEEPHVGSDETDKDKWNDAASMSLLVVIWLGSSK